MTKLHNLHFSLMVYSVIAYSCYNVECLDERCTYHGQWLVICVTNHAEKTCHQSSNITTTLSGVYGALPGHACVKLFFVRGLHFLTGNLVFRNAQVVIGATDPYANIDCGRNRLLFYNSKSVLIYNLSLTNCSAAFNNIYYLTMENVTIQLNNLACGMYAHFWTEVIIRNCQFLNNTSGHMHVYGLRSVYIYGSYFGHGTNETDDVPGVEIITDVTECTIKVIGSIFHNNSHYDLKISGYLFSN